MDNIARKLVIGILYKFGQNSLSNASASLQVNKLIEELNDIIAIAINNQPIDIERYMFDKLFSDVFHDRNHRFIS